MLGRVLLIGIICLSVELDAAKRRPVRRRELIAEAGPSDEQIWDSGLLEKSVSSAVLYEVRQKCGQGANLPWPCMPAMHDAAAAALLLAEIAHLLSGHDDQGQEHDACVQYVAVLPA